MHARFLTKRHAPLFCVIFSSAPPSILHYSIGRPIGELSGGACEPWSDRGSSERAREHKNLALQAFAHVQTGISVLVLNT